MKLTKALQNAVKFANWAVRYEIEPFTAAQIVWWAQEYHRWAVRECNDGSGRRIDKEINRVKDHLNALSNANGFSVKYDGLWPELLEKDISGEWQIITIPDIS